jgi:hypothetical protein
MSSGPPAAPRGNGAPSPEEAAAIAAAIERFALDTAAAAARGASAGSGAGPDAWTRAALLEGVARDDQRELLDPWINT